MLKKCLSSSYPDLTKFKKSDSTVAAETVLQVAVILKVESGARERGSAFL